MEPRIHEYGLIHSFTLAPRCARCSAGVREYSWTVTTEIETKNM